MESLNSTAEEFSSSMIHPREVISQDIQHSRTVHKNELPPQPLSELFQSKYHTKQLFLCGWEFLCEIDNDEKAKQMYSIVSPIFWCNTASSSRLLTSVATQNS
jgi:hypothetical protein